MKGQHIRMTKRLHDLWFKYDTDIEEYIITRPNLDNMLRLFGEELAYMKQADKEHNGQMDTSVR